MNIRLLGSCTAVSLALAAYSSGQSIIFDDFNATEGHFGYAPTFASQSVGDDATSTADRTTTDGSLEGLGHQKLTLVHDATATPLRIRHLSGGPPYNSTNAGTPAGN